MEIIPTEEEAQQLVTGGKRAAVFVFGPLFSEKMTRSSFLADGVNPLFRDGVKIEELDAHVLRDPTQLTAASIIEQVGQVTMLRVVLPWMIGRAFEKIGDQMGRFVQNALGRMFPNYNLTGKTWAALTRRPGAAAPAKGPRSPRIRPPPAAACSAAAPSATRSSSPPIP